MTLNITDLSVQYIWSRKGKRLIELHGYTYHQSRKEIIMEKGGGTNGESNVEKLKIRWRCSTHYPKGCRAFIITEGNLIIALQDYHTH